MLQRLLGIKTATPHTAQKVHTQIFFGNSYQSTSFGGIHKHAEKDASKAKIIFVDTNRKKTDAQIQILTLEALKLLPAYRTAQLLQHEEFIHTWEIRRNGNTLYIHADDTQNAIAFTSPNAADDLQKLVVIRSGMDFFKELFFCAYLQNHFNLTIAKLREMPGISTKHIQLFSDHILAISELTSLGISLNQLATLNIDFLQLLIDYPSALKETLHLGITPTEILNIEYKRLEPVLTNKYDLENALQFVTLRQILRLDETPLTITEVKKPDQGIFFGAFGGGSWGDYLAKRHSNQKIQTVIIKHLKKPEIFKAEEYQLKDEAKTILQEQFKNSTIQKFIHDWHILKENKTTIMYSPALNTILHETHELDVPPPYLKIQLFNFQFYYEKRFADFLKDKNCPIETFRELPGMSKQKLLLLSKNQCAIEELLKIGIKMEDFANIEDLRLENLLVHYKKLPSTLKFVPLATILNLPTTPVLDIEPPAEEKKMSLS